MVVPDIMDAPDPDPEPEEPLDVSETIDTPDIVDRRSDARLRTVGVMRIP